MKSPYEKVIECIITESAELYHSKAKDNLSSHQLIDFIRCPQLHRQKKLGIIADIDSTAFALGRAAHTVILEGDEKFKSEYAVGGPINPKTQRPYGDKTNKFKEWAKEQNKPVVSFDDALTIESLKNGFNANATARRLVSTGIAEGVIRTNLYGIESQIRIDWFNPDEGMIDLKTTRNLDFFEDDALRYRYFNQLAFYQEVIFCATGLIVPVYIIAVEKKAPYRCGVWQLEQRDLASANTENISAINWLKTCHKANNWPTGYETIRFLSLV